jgi:serine O-acetyltransferase
MQSGASVQEHRSGPESLIARLGRLLLDSGTQALLLHRAAHWLWRQHMPLPAAVLRRLNIRRTGADLHPSAVIGCGVRLIHSVGIIIGPGAVVGDNCDIFGGVVLGGRGGACDTDGCPAIGHDTVLCVGAKILGPVCVGHHVTIAAGSVVLDAVPDTCLAAGMPAAVLKVFTDGGSEP